MTGISLFTLLFATSCLKDEGNYDYVELEDFYVDTVGVRHNFTVKQFESFELTPKLIYEGDKSSLEYKWELYKSEDISIGASSYGTGFAHNYTRDDYPDYTLANTEDLSVVISAVPGSYYLVFTATEPKTGVKAMMDYQLQVEGAIGTGLVVLYQGISGIDIDVVSSPVFNGSLTEATFARHAYSTANESRPFAGEPRELVAAIYPANSYYYIYLTSTEDAVRLSSIDMSVAEEFEEMFAGKAPEKKDLSHIIVNGTAHFFVNDGVAYKCNYSSALMTPLAMRNGMYEAVATNFTYAGNSVWYDALNRRFLHSMMWSAEIAPIVNASGAFDFGNVGKDLLYWSKGYYQGNDYANYCFFKNPSEDGQRYLYVFLADQASGNSFTAKCAMDISACPDIVEAHSFATGERGPIVFYSTDSKVYRMNYNIDEGTSSAENVWSPAAGEYITRIELFKNAGINLENSALDKYLLVATYNESTAKGKIYVIQSDISSGILNPEPAAIYEFDGRIADFDFMAQ